MTLYDLYLDKNVSGYIVFKTLSKRKVIEMIHHRYKGTMKIEESDLYQLGECLVIEIKDYEFLDYVEFYNTMMCNTSYPYHIVKNDMFDTVMNTAFLQSTAIRLESVIIGSTMLCQNFIMKFNIRKQQFVLDIYFQNGNCYYYCNHEVYAIDDENLYQKYIKKYKIT